MSLTGSRISTVHLVGGRPCLDLVNTVSWRGDDARREDHLASSEDCLVWCRRAGVVTEGEARELAGLDIRSPLLTLRSALTRHLADADRPDLERLRPFVDNALRHSDLVQSGERAQWEVSTLTSAAPAHRVALDLLDQLTNPPGPVDRCADPACGWAYVDTSRGHRRRWCSSADCGNRERVRRHAARA